MGDGTDSCANATGAESLSSLRGKLRRGGSDIASIEKHRVAAITTDMKRQHLAERNQLSHPYGFSNRWGGQGLAQRQQFCNPEQRDAKISNEFS
jgi:hypothetical protein